MRWILMLNVLGWLAPFTLVMASLYTGCVLQAKVPMQFLENAYCIAKGSGSLTFGLLAVGAEFALLDTQIIWRAFSKITQKNKIDTPDTPKP
jgi:hypothetical protein